MHQADIQPHRVYDHSGSMDVAKKLGWAAIGIGSLTFLLGLSGGARDYQAAYLFSSYGLLIVGSLVVVGAQLREAPAGIKNNKIFLSGLTNRGALGWVLGVTITAFYFFLYWFPESMENWIRLLDPFSLAFRHERADQWFFYGIFYTLAVLLMGARMMVKYRHNRYQILRTGSVMFFQLVFAFLIPELLIRLNQPEFYFTYFWPLKSQALFPDTIHGLLNTPGALGQFLVFWSMAMTFVATPILTYFFGKRWYCSWVCGCGGLAETAGDPFRQLSDKSLRAWKIERWMIHTVLVLVVVMTGLLWLNSAYQGDVLGRISQKFAQVYGFVIGAVFSGIAGVGFYPILGSRVWCRFGCPMAAVLGILQKTKSRFRITTNGAQCISCGNCSTYCEMGIDVRWYAQRQENIVRASCVGCGICSAVCPRGVLKLENGVEEGRFHPAA